MKVSEISLGSWLTYGGMMDLDPSKKVILKACTKRNPRPRYAVSAMAKTTILLARLLPRRWFDAAIRKQFYLPGPGEVG